MKKLFQILFIISNLLSAFTIAKCQTVFKTIDSTICLGKLDDAKSLIEKEITTKKSKNELADLYKLNGDVFKLEGNIEEALKNWEISNQLRSNYYSNGDYHLAWNYALLSNYYYEKINTPLAKLYADSCQSLLKELTIEKIKV